MIGFIAIGISLGLAGAAAGDGLAVPGQRAPDLENVRWIQGEPVKQFESGRVYVVDFWSTWCEACIEPIDHLNALAQRYEDDATFIAIHIWQREAAPEPAKFLAKRRIASKSVLKFAIVEDADDVLAKTWMDATENGGLPTSMIVDRASRLAWFGHSKDLDGPLREIIDGTYDTQRSIEMMNRGIQAGRKANESGKAIEKGDYEWGMTLMLEAFRAAPKTVAEWIPSTYGHMLHASQSQETAARFVRKVLATKEGNTAALHAGFARMILNFRNSDQCDLSLALELAEKANIMSESSDPFMLSTLAEVRAERKDVSGAIEAIERAIKMATDRDKLERFNKTLQEFQKLSNN